MDIAFHVAWWWLPLLLMIIGILALPRGRGDNGVIAFYACVIAAVAVTIGHYLPL